VPLVDDLESVGMAGAVIRFTAQGGQSVGTPWGAAAFFGGLLFGTWMRARPAYWFLVAGEGLTVASLATFGQLLGLAVVPLVLCTGARFALLLSRPVRSMIGESRSAAAITSAT
jgi:hypothetical protein